MAPKIHRPVVTGPGREPVSLAGVVFCSPLDRCVFTWGTPPFVLMDKAGCPPVPAVAHSKAAIWAPPGCSGICTAGCVDLLLARFVRWLRHPGFPAAASRLSASSEPTLKFRSARRPLIPDKSDLFQSQGLVVTSVCASWSGLNAVGAEHSLTHLFPEDLGTVPLRRTSPPL